jgi:hypothetical protein
MANTFASGGTDKTADSDIISRCNYVGIPDRQEPACAASDIFEIASASPLQAVLILASRLSEPVIDLLLHGSATLGAVVATWATE